MLSHSSTGVAVVDAQEDFLRASAMANETPAPDITRLPIRRNVALLSAAVAATTELTERTQSCERGRLLGFNDLLSGATGAVLTLLGGLALTAAGVAALAIGAMALVAAPALWILRAGTVQRRPPHRTDYLRRTPCTHVSPSLARAHADLRAAR
jgi:hypothetical protein